MSKSVHAITGPASWPGLCQGRPTKADVPGNYRADMKKPRRREIIRGFLTFFWTGVPNGYGGSPQVRAENVLRGDRFH